MKNSTTLRQVLKRAVIISIVAVVLLTSAAAVIAYFAASGGSEQSSDARSDSPVYSTSALVLVQSKSSSDALVQSDKVKTSDIGADVMMANTVATLLETAPAMKEYTKDAEVSITPVEDSYFLQITAAADDPHIAANTANRVAQIAPQIVSMYLEDVRVLTVEEANIPTKPATVGHDDEQEQKTDTLPVVLIAALGTLSVSMLLAIILTAAVYASFKKKHSASVYAGAVDRYINPQS